MLNSIALGFRALVSPPSRIRFAERLECWAQRRQGKNYGWDTPQEEARAILHLLPPSAIVFDVGARRGEWTREVMAGARGYIARMVAFDPDPANGPYLALPGVTAVPLAVSMLSGVATLYMDSPGSGHSSLHQSPLLRGGEITVSTTTLDDYCGEHGIDRIDFLKMDVEGHELAVLRGGERLLASGAIRALAFEFGGCNINSRTYFRDFWQLLEPLGFSFSRILPGAKLLPIPRYSELLEQFTIANYVAVRH